MKRMSILHRMIDIEQIQQHLVMAYLLYGILVEHIPRDQEKVVK